MTHAAGVLPGPGPGPGPRPVNEPAQVPAAARRPARLVARSLFAVTKPRIIELLLVTTLPTMLLAERGLPPAWLDGGHADRRRPGRGQREHAELRHRPGHRRRDAAHRRGARWPPPGRRR